MLPQSVVDFMFKAYCNVHNAKWGNQDIDLLLQKFDREINRGHFKI